MAAFSESNLLKKFEALNPSLQSIQTLSFWIIYHRKHCSQIVSIWFREFLATKDSKKLTYMYLANDVIQNSKKKGPEFGKEFAGVLKRAYEHMNKLNIDAKTRAGLVRILSVWEDRNIYETRFIAELRSTLDLRPRPSAPKSGTFVAPSQPDSDQQSQPPNAKRKRRSNDTSASAVAVAASAAASVTVVAATGGASCGIGTIAGTDTSPSSLPSPTATGNTAVAAGSDADGANVSSPEPDQIIQAINELETNPASSDRVVRNKIASLPPAVSEISQLAKLEDRESAELLSAKVDEAVTLLTDYNCRLTNELVSRKKLSVMLKDFIQTQKELLKQAEERLEEYSEKLQKVYHVRQEMKSHIRNLPDLTRLPDVTGGLAPLPSAGDLFSSHS